jgi:hypothetical protein
MPNQSNRSYNFDDLAMLSRILDEVLETTINGAVLTELQIQELSPQLGKVLMDRFVSGETDPAVLKKIAMGAVQQR